MNNNNNLPTQEKETNHIGSFLGFVLLGKPEWDKTQFINDMKSEWNIEISEEDAEDNEEDIIVTDLDGKRLLVSFIPAPIPDGETQYYAKGNYLWSDAEQMADAHKAQILISVLGEHTDMADICDKAKLFVMAVCCALSQKHALAVYTDGAVYEPRFYKAVAEVMMDNEFPIVNLVWFGPYANDKLAGFYTSGMKKFGRDEIEVFVPRDKAEMEEIRDFISDIALYTIECDAVLKDGDTIGFSEQEQLAITRSPGIALEEDTIKIEYPCK